MAFSTVLQRFIDQRPVCVLTRVVLENQFGAARLDAIFEETARNQYTKELLFSTCAELLCQVTLCGAPSVNAVFKKAQERIPVSVVAIYDKLKGVEPVVCEALVQQTAKPLPALLVRLDAKRPEPVPGYRLRIVDGNTLACTEHRLLELRGLNSAAIPGRTLAVYDFATELITGLVACENGHTNERKLMPALLDRIEANDLVVADRLYATLEFFDGLIERKAAFLVRHAGLKLRWLGKRRKAGRCRTGLVFERNVALTNGLVCRAIIIERDKPLLEGGRRVILLTNVPRSRASAKKLAELYLKRWRIEETFRQLTQYLSCEVRTLGYPKAALLAFSLAAIAYNCLVCVRGALASVYGRDKVQDELSPYYVALEVKLCFDGMQVAVPDRQWAKFGQMSPASFAGVLRVIARHVRWKHYTKTKRGPKKTRRRRHVKHRHVATACLLEARRNN
jgi:IS4 transposase